jgi:type II restriction enzyme
MIANGLIAERSKVRSEYTKAKPFSSLPSAVRGWTLDVFRIIEQLPIEFSLADVYAHEQGLTRVHPGNKNIRPKIRQQLQVLRDMGMIRFLGGGDYLRT